MSRGISTNLNIGNLAVDLKKENIAFVARYYSHTTRQRQKRITRSEAQALTNAGVELVAVYEDGPTNVAYFSRERGQQDGKHAHGYAAELGQPEGSAIYFAVDYDALKADTTGVIEEYFEGVHEGLAETNGAAKFEVGVYGSGRVCAHIKEARQLAKYSWLSESHGWAGHAAYTKPDIRQEVARTALLHLAPGVGGGYQDNFATGDKGAFNTLAASSGPVPAAAAAAAPLAPLASWMPSTLARESDGEVSAYAGRVAASALQQYERYHHTSENQSPLKEQIRAYWEELDYTFPGVATAWSAVFTSWVIRTAGASASEFKASSAHSRFVYWAIQNSVNDSGVFRARRVADYAPRIGDIIHNNRDRQSITYDFAARHEAYFSHSAIVVELGTDANGKYAMTVGGNESDSVSRRRLSVHPDGKLVQRASDPYICVIQNLK